MVRFAWGRPRLPSGGIFLFVDTARRAEPISGRRAARAARRAFAGFVAVAAVLLTGQAAWAACTPASGDNVTATCTGTTINQAGGAPGTSGGAAGYGVAVETGLAVTVVPAASVTGSVIGVVFNTGTVTNSGTISGGSFTGIDANITTVTNSGSISGGVIGIDAVTATVTNSGSISGSLGAGMDVVTATVANSGTISGSQFGIIANATAIVTNSGTISGATGISVRAPSTLINSGAVIGTGGTAIDFSHSHTDALTFLPGSHIQGAILLGSGDSVSVVGGPGGSSFLTFTPNGPFSLSASGVAVVAGNQAATLDPTPFGLADKNLMDFTRGISGVLELLGGGTAPSGPLSSAFVPGDNFAARIESTFASIPGLAYADDTAVFKAPTMVARDGRAVWARGFGGQRTQDADGITLGAHTTYLGGAVGFDMVARPDLRLGLFAGGGESRMSLDGNVGFTNTSTAFGGLYGRWGFVSLGRDSFLDFALHGGGSTNATSRTLTSNVAPFLQVATANYNSSYISPELKYGIDVPLWAQYTLTPSLRVRYVAGFFGGYTETGSSANLTVASRTIQDIEERGELKLTRATPIGPDLLLTSVHVGAIGLERFGDTTVNTVLLGANLPFVTPGKNDVSGIVGGGGVEWRTREGVSVFGNVEAIGFSDQSTVWSALGGVRVAF